MKASFTHYNNGIRLKMYLLNGEDYISYEISDNGWKRIVVSKGDKFINTLTTMKDAWNWYNSN